MEGAFAQFEQAYRSKIKIVKLNVDNKSSADSQEYSKFMDSRYIPYTIVLKNGITQFKKVGAMSAAELGQAADSVK